MKKPIILMTTLYPSALNDSHRTWELKKCLEINLENEDITEIVIFFQRESKDYNPFNEGFNFLENPKIKIHYLTNNPIKRPTFKDFFEYANINYPKKHIIICNSDIFFYKDSNIHRLTELRNHNEFWFLTRYSFVDKWKKWVIAPFGWEIGKNSTKEDMPNFKNWEVVTDLDEYDSLAKELDCNQVKNRNEILSFGTVDSYCFYAPLKKTNFDIFLGTAGCENYLRLKAIGAGLKLLNPAFSIISRHLHISEESNYSGISYFDKKDYYKAILMLKSICFLEEKIYDKYDSLSLYKHYKNFIANRLEKYFPNLYKVSEKIYHKLK